jgi:hypothetical protein
MATLEKEGIIKYVPPMELLNDYETTIAKAIKGDLADRMFRQICRDYEVKYCVIYGSKIPRQLRSLIERESIRIHKKLGLPERMKLQGERSLVLPTDIGESIMINHALCATDKFSLTPVTDDNFQHQLFALKLRSSDSDAVKKLLVDYGYVKDIQSDLAAIEVVEDSVPMLYSADMNDILEFRDQNREALNRYKIEMSKLVTEVESNLWDEDFHKKVVDIINAHVKPSLEEIKDSVETNKEKLGRILRKGATLAPIPIQVTLLPGVDPIYGLLLSAGLLCVNEYLDTQRKKRTMHKNSFAFLFDAQKRFAR